MVAAGVHPWRETHNVNKVSLEDVAAEAALARNDLQQLRHA